MTTVEIIARREVSDDAWMDAAACKGLTHLFFPAPAERPQSVSDVRPPPAWSVRECSVRRPLSRLRPRLPRVRGLGRRERRRASRGRVPVDRPHRRAIPPHRLIRPATIVGCHPTCPAPDCRFRAPIARRCTRRGAVRHGDRRRHHRRHRGERAWSRPTEVYRLALDDGNENVIAKVSSYRLVLPVRRGPRPPLPLERAPRPQPLLPSPRSECSAVMGEPSRGTTASSGSRFYEEIDRARSLAKVLDDDQVENLTREMAHLHPGVRRRWRRRSRRMSNSVKADAIPPPRAARGARSLRSCCSG